jgi:hypothetical protein
MNISRRRFLALSGTTLCALASAGCAAALFPSPSLYDISMRYPHWKTHCVGRFLVDFPATATIKMEAYIDGKKFTKLPNCTPQQVRQMAVNKIVELKHQPHITRGNKFIRAIELPRGGILVQGFDFPDSEITSSVYIYIIPENAISVAYYYENDLGQSRENFALRFYKELGSSVRALEPGVIPKESGFCMGEFMLLDMAIPLENEECWIRVELPDAPEVILSFKTRLAKRDYALILERSDSVKRKSKNIDEEKCDILRKAKRNVGPILGEELCVAADDSLAHYRKYSFAWESASEPFNVNKPMLDATLLFRGPDITKAPAPQPFSSDAEALALWDRVVNSIRIRPVE